MEHPIVRAAIFILIAVLTSLSFRWLFQLALISSGTKMRDVLEFLSTLAVTKHRGRFLDGYLTDRSPEPGRTARLLRLHHLGSLIIAACIILPAVGMTTNLLDTAMRWGMIIIPVIISAVGIGGQLYLRRNDIRLPTLSEDFADLRHVIYKKQIEPFEQSGRSYAGGCLKGILIVGFMFGIFMLIIHAAYAPMTPAERADVESAASAAGCVMLDLTEDTRAAWDAGDALSLALAGENGSMRINYFVFDTDARALNVCSQYLDIIRAQSTGGEEYQKNQANHFIFTLTDDTTYYALYCVDNTLLRAQAPRDDAEAVRDILRSIGYLDDK